MVEDNKSLRLLTTRWLQRLGYQVLEASNGPEAVDLWNKDGNSVSLLLTGTSGYLFTPSGNLLSGPVSGQGPWQPLSTPGAGGQSTAQCAPNSLKRTVSLGLLTGRFASPGLT